MIITALVVLFQTVEIRVGFTAASFRNVCIYLHGAVAAFHRFARNFVGSRFVHAYCPLDFLPPAGSLGIEGFWFSMESIICWNHDDVCGLTSKIELCWLVIGKITIRARQSNACACPFITGIQSYTTGFIRVLNARSVVDWMTGWICSLALMDAREDHHSSFD